MERAWKRGLEFGRYKAVDDTLAHAVEAYSGIPNVFFTWVRRSDKRIRFEFLDNTVRSASVRAPSPLATTRPSMSWTSRACSTSIAMARIDVDAAAPEQLYRDPALLARRAKRGFLKRCVRDFIASILPSRRAAESICASKRGAGLRSIRTALRGGDRGCGYSRGPRWRRSRAVAPAALTADGAPVRAAAPEVT